MRALLLGTILLAACNTGPRFRVDAQQVALRGKLGVEVVLRGATNPVADPIQSTVERLDPGLFEVTLTRPAHDVLTDRICVAPDGCDVVLLPFDDINANDQRDFGASPLGTVEGNLRYRSDLSHTDPGWITSGFFEVDVEGDAHALDGPTFRLTPAAFNDLVF